MLRSTLFALASAVLLGVGCQSAQTNHSAEFASQPHQPVHAPHQVSNPGRYSYGGATQVAPVSRSLQRPCGTFG